MFLNFDEVAIVQWRPAQQGNQHEREEAHPRHQVKSVNNAQRIGLETEPARDNAGGSPGCRSKAGRLRKQSGGQLVDIGIGDPASALYVESEKIGVQLLSLCNEVL